MGNLVEHAKRELELAGAFNGKGDIYNGMLGKAVMELIELFESQHHSGMSASIAINMFKQVASYEPLTPLTGEDDEWSDTYPQQNKRCSHVFRDKGKGAYDIQGVVYEENSGAKFTSSGSHTPVTFPYIPKSEIVKVDR